MVQAEEMRKAFVARLKIALAANEIPERGAGARLAKIIKSTPKATSKWLNAESMPKGTNMRTVADALRVRAEWLEYGVPPMRNEGHSGVRLPSADSHQHPVDATSNDGNKLLMALASPRSKGALAKIIEAAECGRLTEDDVILLEQIATKIAGAPVAKNTNAKLREKLALDDPHSSE